MNKGTLTTQGRVTIPKRIRDYLGLLPGDTLRFEYEDDGAVRILPPRKPAQGKGSRFDDFLKEEGIHDEVRARALRRALAEDVAGTKLHLAFLNDAARTDVATRVSGVGYAMPDMHANVSTKVRGERVKRPRPVKGRK